jgi:hypothetical protein
MFCEVSLYPYLKFSYNHLYSNIIKRLKYLKGNDLATNLYLLFILL